MTSQHTEGNHGALGWAVRDSFLRYVTVIAAGGYETVDVELDESGRFTFPLMQAARQDEEWHFWFGGSVNFRAHNGFLDVTIDHPEVTIGPTGGVLSTRSSEGLLHFAEISAVDPVIIGDEVRWDGAEVHLTQSGVPLFGDVYPAGTVLSPMYLTATLVRS